MSATLHIPSPTLTTLGTTRPSPNTRNRTLRKRKRRAIIIRTMTRYRHLLQKDKTERKVLREVCMILMPKPQVSSASRKATVCGSTAGDSRAGSWARWRACRDLFLKTMYKCYSGLSLVTLPLALSLSLSFSLLYNNKLGDVYITFEAWRVQWFLAFY